MFKLVLILFLVCLTQFVIAQSGSQIELIQANSMEYDRSINNAKRLIGDVILKHEGTYLYCDQAFLYSETNIVDATGKVHMIMHGTTHAYGDKLHYEGKTGMARLEGNTRMIDNQALLTTSYMDFDMHNNKAMYYTGAKIVKGDNVLTSQFGTYDTRTKEMFYKKDVVLVNPDYTIKCDTLKYNTQTDITYFIGPTNIDSKENNIFCERGWYNTKTDVAVFTKNPVMTSKNSTLRGDSIYYNRNTHVGKAYHNISMIDTVEKTMLTGDYGQYYELTDRMLVTGHAVMILIDKPDSLYMHADTLISKNDSNVKTLFAFHHARFFRNDIQGASDSIVYTFADSSIRLFRKPIIWSNENQMTADSIRIQLSNNQIEKMFFNNASFIISEYDTSRYNQIKGKDMTAFFVNNEIFKILVVGGAETIYYLTEEDSTLIGVNKSQSNRLYIWVKENKVYKITFLDKPEATLYPESDLTPADILLKGFLWSPLLRPKNKDDIY